MLADIPERPITREEVIAKLREGEALLAKLVRRRSDSAPATRTINALAFVRAACTLLERSTSTPTSGRKR